ncbi:MAG: hypothetical protein NTX59_04135 [Elusimicrobia bacterium]|nr:hypothetical protein [Elusimicrobiota bacterium]
MSEDLELTKKKFVNRLALSAVILGGALNLIPKIIFFWQPDNGFKLDLKNFACILFWWFYLSIPFIMLAVVVKFVLRRSNMGQRAFFMRMSGIAGAFAFMQAFYFIYDKYFCSGRGADIILYALYAFSPLLNILVLPFGYFIGFFSAYIFCIFYGKKQLSEGLRLRAED